MASTPAPADDDFDFADDTVADEAADFDWDDLDESEQSPAKAVPKSATAPPAAAPAPSTASTAPQPTAIVTKVGPIPFRDPSPPASSSPAAPIPTAGTPAVARQPSATPSGALPSSNPAVAGSPASALPQRTLVGLADKPGPPTARVAPQPQLPPSAAPLTAKLSETSAAAAAAGAATGATGPSEVPASTLPARQYSQPAGQPAAGPSPKSAGTSVSPQLKRDAASPAVGPPPPTYAVAGSPAAQAAAGPTRAAAATAARQPGMGTAAASRAEAAADPPKPAAATSSTVSGQNVPAATSATSQLAHDMKQPAGAQAFNAVPAAAAAAAGGVGNAPAPAQGSSRAAGGGWGGWGFGGLTNKLQQVALGAAKDLQELTASVQQVVAEVVAADDVSEVDRLSAYQERPSRPGPAPPAGAAAPPAAVTASRGDSMPHLPGTRPASSVEGPAAGPRSLADTSTAAEATELDWEEQKRQEVLKRLQGQDTQLESGLKAIDDQVDLIAAGAAKALGSLWGGFSTVAKQTVTVGAAITAKVEAAAKEVAKELAVGLEEGGQAATAPGAAPAAPGVSGISLREAASHLAARAERTLESVGRSAVSLLDPQFGRSGSSGSQQHLGRSPSDWAATFDSCFELYGGEQAAEELEQLSSECARICNRARANLQLEAKQQIDATLSKLAPTFDLRSSTGEQHASASSSQDDEHVQEAFEQLYLPVRSICSKGKYRASQLQQEATQAAPEAAAADASAADSGTAADAGSTAEIQPVDRASKEQAGVPAGDVGSSAGSGGSQLEQLLQRLLAGLRSVAVKSLAEVSAGQLMLLLSLGRSLAALPRYGKPLDDGLEWPADPEAVAQLMQQQARAMLADMQQLAGVFKDAAPAILQALQNAAAAHGQLALACISSELAAQHAKAAAEGVEADCGTALAYVKDGFGKLLYVVLLASLHRAGLQEQQEQKARPVESSSDASANTAAV